MDTAPEVFEEATGSSPREAFFRVGQLVMFPLQAVGVVCATLVIAPLVILFATLGWQSGAYETVRLWCRIFDATYGVRFTVHGLENVPEGPAVLVSNHCSHFDGPTLILALPQRFYFIIKRELTRIPLWGQAALKLGYIPIDRGQSDKAKAQMNGAVETVRGGRRVLVFAEGTRSRSECMGPFKKGAFHLAVDAQVPILPIAICNSRQVLPKGWLIPRPGTIDYRIGEALPTIGLSKEDVPSLLEATRQSIAALRDSSRRDRQSHAPPAPAAGAAGSPAD